MIAYNETMLDNLALYAQLDQAVEKHCISETENKTVRTAYKVDFYSPNIYVRIGLFILTIITISFSFGLLSLISSTYDKLLGPSLILYGVGTICILEYFIRRNRHYRSGVDDALLWIAGGFILSGLFMLMNSPSTVWICVILCLMAVAAVIRYVDRGMAILAYSALMGFIMYSMMQAGALIQSMIPFMLMAVSFSLFLFSSRSLKKNSLRHYRPVLQVLKLSALAGLYLVGNYFVVREMEQLLSPVSSSGTPFLKVFWVSTLLIPLIYLYTGIRKKDNSFLWLGLLLSATSVATVRYYYSFMPPETAMGMAGVLLIAIAYICFRYFKSPKYGITEKQIAGDPAALVLRWESLLAAQLGATSTSPTAPATTFGGGSGGGGGAGGTF